MTIKYRGHEFEGYNKPKKAPAGAKEKMMVLAKKGDEVKLVRFGLRGMEDFTQHKDADRRKNYLARSAGIRDKDGKLAMPVHGEWRHLRANADLARETGIERVIEADNGVVVDLKDGIAKIVGAVPAGYVYVDGMSVGEVSETSLKDRRVLGEEGFISIVVVVDTSTGKITAGPDIHARGFHDDEKIFDEARIRIEKALGQASADGVGDTYQLSQIVRRTVGQWVSSEYGRKPMILPIVIDV